MRDDGTFAAIGVVAALCVARATARRLGSRSVVEWNLDRKFGYGEHASMWFDDHEVPREKIEWWGIDGVYPDQDYLNMSKVVEYAQAFRDGDPVPAIFIENDGRVRDGHHRLEAAVRVGVTEIPVVVLDYDSCAGGEE